MKKAIIFRFRDTNKFKTGQIVKGKQLEQLDKKVKEHNSSGSNTFIEIIEDELIIDILDFKIKQLRDQELSSKMRKITTEMQDEIKGALENIEYLNTLSAQLDELTFDIETERTFE